MVRINGEVKLSKTVYRERTGNQDWVKCEWEDVQVADVVQIIRPDGLNVVSAHDNITSTFVVIRIEEDGALLLGVLPSYPESSRIPGTNRLSEIGVGPPTRVWKYRAPKKIVSGGGTITYGDY